MHFHADVFSTAETIQVWLRSALSRGFLSVLVTVNSMHFTVKFLDELSVVLFGNMLQFNDIAENYIRISQRTIRSINPHSSLQLCSFSWAISHTTASINPSQTAMSSNIETIFECLISDNISCFRRNNSRSGNETAVSSEGKTNGHRFRRERSTKLQTSRWSGVVKW